MPVRPPRSEIDLLFAYARTRGRAGALARAAFDRGVDAGWGLSVNGPAGLTALGTASLGRQPALVSRLLLAGAKPEIPGTDGQAPLALAIQSGCTDSAFLLLDHGASPETLSADGTPALVLAAAFDRVSLISRLAKLGARLDQRDAKGRTALMRAASGVHQKSVRALNKCHAPLDSVDLEGLTALMHSALTRNPYGPFHDLLRCGASPLPCDRSGRSVMDIVVELSHHTIHLPELRAAIVRAEALELEKLVPQTPAALRGARL